MGNCGNKVLDESADSVEIKTKPEASTRSLLVNSLHLAMVGNTERDLKNGQELYKFLFTVHPRLQKHFMGAEEFMNEDTKKTTNVPFSKQGQKLLMAIHVLASSFDTEETFNAYVKEIINRHVEREVDPALWKEFFKTFCNFLRRNGEISPETEDAWHLLGDRFNEVAQGHLETLGLPNHKD